MKVHKYVLHRLFHDEYQRFLGRYSQNPIAGLKRALSANKIKYEIVDDKEIIIVMGEKRLRLKQEDRT